METRLERGRLFKKEPKKIQSQEPQVISMRDVFVKYIELNDMRELLEKLTDAKLTQGFKAIDEAISDVRARVGRLYLSIFGSPPQDKHYFQETRLETNKYRFPDTHSCSDELVSERRCVRSSSF